MMFSMFSLLDEHSSYMPKETFDRFMSSLEGNTAGIGVEMIVKNGRMVIRKVLEGSPAQKAGLQKRDVIAVVNGENVLDLPYDEAAGKISGPLGSTVQIGVLRGDSEEVLSFFLVRAITEENPVTLKIVDEKTAYIGLSSFTENAAQYMAEALAEVDRQGITKIIFDLRQNGGGYLTSAVKLADMLLPAGVFCYVEHKKPEDLETFYSQNQNPKYKLAILVDSRHRQRLRAVFGKRPGPWCRPPVRHKNLRQGHGANHHAPGNRRRNPPHGGAIFHRKQAKCAKKRHYARRGGGKY